MSVFRIFFSFVYQFCIRKNERTFPSKRARVFLKTNGRFTSFVRSFDAKRAFVLDETCVCFKRAIYTVRPAII